MLSDGAIHFPGGSLTRTMSSTSGLSVLFKRKPQIRGHAEMVVRPRRRASSSCRANNRESLRLAREGEQLGYAAGQRPMDAQNRSLWLIKMSLTSVE